MQAGHPRVPSHLHVLLPLPSLVVPHFIALPPGAFPIDAHMLYLFSRLGLSACLSGVQHIFDMPTVMHTTAIHHLCCPFHHLLVYFYLRRFHLDLFAKPGFDYPRPVTS